MPGSVASAQAEESEIMGGHIYEEGSARELSRNYWEHAAAKHRSSRRKGG